ncbi:hypothetical protein [Streptomyces sp. NPDC127039]|uniref:hypothetical protein n=1 Tax=Streptomyces sp. NPDC127039 TaxID=3347115 RepID=UPI0036641307
MVVVNLHPNAHPIAAAFRDPVELAAALSGTGSAVRAQTRAITRHHASLGVHLPLSDPQVS